MSTVRTRFAPSPTGYLHVGGIRTALFAWLVARQAGGQFILRIEDTDRNREVEGAEAHIIKSLRALGLEYDEGPDVPGEYGPYRQTERLDRYKEWAQVLIDSGRAYADPYTAEEVQGFREQAQKDKKPFLYRNHRPENPPAWDGTTPLRFKSEPQDYQWKDAVMGDLHAGAEAIDDFILVKSDGFPTYNFAHMVDDHDMAITHVIRGQEFISSMPNYLNLYEALGFERPILATMPHILNEQGNKKLSKRDGAKDVLDYLRDGYLVEAMINFIASLGWNDGTTQEIFSREELIEKFSLERVQKAGARFDEQRLHWMNGAWIRASIPCTAAPSPCTVVMQGMSAVTAALRISYPSPRVTSDPWGVLMTSPTPPEEINSTEDGPASGPSSPVASECLRMIWQATPWRRSTMPVPAVATMSKPRSARRLIGKIMPRLSRLATVTKIRPEVGSDP